MAQSNHIFGHHPLFLDGRHHGMIIGRQIDRYGPKWVLILGSVVIGAGFVLLSRITTVWQLYLVYFMMALGFSSTSLVPVNTLITNWFIRRRGFAMSLTNTGLSAGGIVLVPLASYMISRWGLETALPVLGAIYCAVVIPSALFFVRQRPADLHQFPDGETWVGTLRRTGRDHRSTIRPKCRCGLDPRRFKPLHSGRL